MSIEKEEAMQALDVLKRWTPAVNDTSVTASALVVAAAAQLYLASKYLEESSSIDVNDSIDVALFAQRLASLVSDGTTLGIMVLSEAERERSENENMEAN